MMKTLDRTGRHRMLAEPKPLRVDIAQLAEFLRDPIAYGHFDWDDPITLEEFSTCRHHRGRHAAPLAF